MAQMPPEIGLPNTAVPGDTIEIQFRILDQDPAKIDAAIHSLKQAVWADPRFDYQGSKVVDVSDVNLRQPIKLLLIFVTVRQTPRNSREPIHYVTMSSFEAYMKAAAIVFPETLAYIGAKVREAVALAAESVHAVNKSLPYLAVAAVLIAAVVFGKTLLEPAKGGD